ncbi:uncharacterized protein LOC131310928 isoform X1 [Rhododendron vialii]|uniref:uncharacterized protein LOC131310928 isoform X1 n=1 Tax=Rhododendron vialii TaxID=182163 RepID=UPI00265E2B1C|nr:uncharacterized protein LOC131310928 isoform X1 [Rhododendron vialii]
MAPPGLLLNPPKLGVLDPPKLGCFRNNPHRDAIKTPRSLCYAKIAANFAPRLTVRAAAAYGNPPLDPHLRCLPGHIKELLELFPNDTKIPLTELVHPDVRDLFFIGGFIGGVKKWALPLTHPDILKPARRAVELYNQEQNARLEFVSLLEAYSVPARGFMYYLTLEAMDDGVMNKYEVQILSDAGKLGTLVLESFWLVADNKETYYTSLLSWLSRLKGCLNSILMS